MAIDTMPMPGSYGLPGAAAEIHLSLHSGHETRAMVCREPPLRYTRELRASGASPAMVCREPPLRYTGSTANFSSTGAMVCREPPLRYTGTTLLPPVSALWFAGSRR